MLDAFSYDVSGCENKRFGLDVLECKGREVNYKSEAVLDPA